MGLVGEGVVERDAMLGVQRGDGARATSDELAAYQNVPSYRSVDQHVQSWANEYRVPRHQIRLGGANS